MHTAASLMEKTEEEGMKTSQVFQIESQIKLIYTSNSISSFIYCVYVDVICSVYDKHCFSLQTALSDQNWYTSTHGSCIPVGKPEDKQHKHIRLMGYVERSTSSGGQPLGVVPGQAGDWRVEAV